MPPQRPEGGNPSSRDETDYLRSGLTFQAAAYRGRGKKGQRRHMKKYRLGGIVNHSDASRS